MLYSWLYKYYAPATPPYKPFHKWGCPAPNPPIECVSKHTSCIHEDNRNVYRVVKTRTWWHCGKACYPTTLCKYWSFRHSDRKCFLMKSCCRTDGDKAYQSGDNKCPVA